MADKQAPHPRTRRTLELQEGDIVWADAKGWGIVVGTDGTCRWSRVDTRNEFRDRSDDGVCHAVSWPDVEEVETTLEPLRKVLEPVKLRGPIESSIERVQDPLATAVEVGYAGLLREDGPRSFRLAWALRRPGFRAPGAAPELVPTNSPRTRPTTSSGFASGSSAEGSSP